MNAQAVVVNQGYKQQDLAAFCREYDLKACVQAIHEVGLCAAAAVGALKKGVHALAVAESRPGDRLGLCARVEGNPPMKRRPKLARCRLVHNNGDETKQDEDMLVDQPPFPPDHYKLGLGHSRHDAPQSPMPQHEDPLAKS